MGDWEPTDAQPTNPTAPTNAMSDTIEQAAFLAATEREVVRVVLVEDCKALIAEAQREAFEAGLETERVYGGEGGWEWFHKPSGNISKGKDAAFAAYLTRQAGQ